MDVFVFILLIGHTGSFNMFSVKNADTFRQRSRKNCFYENSDKCLAFQKNKEGKKAPEGQKTFQRRNAHSLAHRA